MFLHFLRYCTIITTKTGMLSPVLLLLSETGVRYGIFQRCYRVSARSESCLHAGALCHRTSRRRHHRHVPRQAPARRRTAHASSCVHRRGVRYDDELVSGTESRRAGRRVPYAGTGRERRRLPRRRQHPRHRQAPRHRPYDRRGPVGLGVHGPCRGRGLL